MAAGGRLRWFRLAVAFFAAGCFYCSAHTNAACVVQAALFDAPAICATACCDCSASFSTYADAGENLLELRGCFVQQLKILLYEALVHLLGGAQRFSAFQTQGIRAGGRKCVKNTEVLKV